MPDLWGWPIIKFNSALLSKVRIDKTRQSHIVARLSLYCGCIVAKIVLRLGLDEGEMVSILCPKFG